MNNLFINCQIDIIIMIYECHISSYFILLKGLIMIKKDVKKINKGTAPRKVVERKSSIVQFGFTGITEICHKAFCLNCIEETDHMHGICVACGDRNYNAQ